MLKIVGAGLAGSEAAWQIAKRGGQVSLYEMRPDSNTKAHQTAMCAELVCSNSFRGAALSNAVGLLKEELKQMDSLIMEAAIKTRVPAGGALAVDRTEFSRYIDQKIRRHPRITFIQCEVAEIPESDAKNPVVIASGPLTSPALTKSVENLCGAENLAFFDAISPIVLKETIDFEHCFRQSRYDKGDGGDDYLNIPFTKGQYLEFVEAVAKADKYLGNLAVENDSLEKLRPFEGCMPIEDMVERGIDTLRFGPLKPVGLRDPKTGQTPYAVMQMRQDDSAGELWSLVGMQTRMKRADQLAIFGSLPALRNAEFVRLGSVHRNTFIDSPKCLEPTLEFRGKEGLFFAGQITGTEGYVESTAGGLIAGINAYRLSEGLAPIIAPIETATGALMAYISDPSRKNFQPMNISFGLMPSYLNGQFPRGTGKKARRELVSKKAIELIQGLQYARQGAAEKESSQSNQAV